MRGSASSSWPTARASENENRTLLSAPSHGKTHGEVLAGVAGDFMAKWPTATVTDANGARSFALDGASDGEKGGPNQSFGAGGTPLPAQAAQWPTPAARDHKGENSPDHLTNGTGRLHMDQLPNAVAHGFTPPDLPTQAHGVPSSITRPISRRLFRSAMSSVPPTTLRRWLRRGAWKKRRLNPAFVEWLMGWPPGHALCDCSAMEFSRWQQDMRSALSQLPTASGPWIWAPPPETVVAQQMNLFG